MDNVLPSPPSSLRCRDLVVRYGDQPAVLDRLSCDVPAGEIVSLVGQSGCGKTTLLRTLAGLQPASSGRVEIQPPAEAQRGRMAFVFQQPTLLPWRTALENVSLAIQLCSTASGRQAARRAAEELAAMELPAAAMGRFPRQLSGGMKMRVSLARGLVMRPTVLLLDEPFAALDDMSRTALGELLLRRWEARPFTAVLVTHNIAEATLLSHRIFVMAAGQLGPEIIDDLPRPRDQSLRASAQFGRLYGQVAAALRQDPATVASRDMAAPGATTAGGEE